MESNDRLQHRLRSLVACPLEVIITNNTRSMISFRKTTVPLRLRLHHMFLDADEHILRSLADYIRTGRLAPQIREYIRMHSHKIKPSEKKNRCIRLRHQGRCYNLKEIYNRINSEYFNERVDSHISWGNQARGKNRRSIRFGSFVERDNLIRIHPLLDRPQVPLFFVEYIVFHEMLHTVERRSAGSIHTREYKKREREFQQYEQARKWEKKNIRLFIR